MMSHREAARRAHEDALHDDDAQRLYENAPCGYVSTLLDSTIVKVNETFLIWTGFRREDLVGTKFSALMTPGGQIFRETHLLPLIQMNGSLREIALDIIKADGERLPLLINATLDRDDEGEPAVIRTAIFDASERRSYERELVLAKKNAEGAQARAVALARTLQDTLIPPTAPVVPGLDVAAVYRSAGDGSEVGGDFYDVFQIADGDWVVVIGDVRGKGVEAAVVTSLVRHTVRALAVQLRDPSELLYALNALLLAQEVDRFCTVAFLRLRQDGATWSASLGLGGHPLAMLRRGGEDVVPYGAAGTVVGVLDTPVFHDAHTELGPGDTVLLYTDGVTEGRSEVGFYGEERLGAEIDAHTGSAQQLADHVVSDAVDFQDGTTRDDIVVVVVAVPHTFD